MSKAGRQVLSLCTTIFLARQLTPEEFGAVAVILGVLALGLPLQEADLVAATVQRARVSVQAISTMFWINATLGLTLTLLFAAMASPLADFLRQPELVPLCHALSLTFVLNGLAAQHRALLQRSMRFGTTTWIDLGSALTGGLGAIVMALAGFGYWALVAQWLIGDTLALLMLISVVRWKLTRPSFTAEVRDMVSFGAPLLGFNIVLAFANNLHVVLLGRGVGTAAAGHYTRAYALASIPQSLLQTAASHVATAKLSRAQANRAGFATFYCSGVQLLSLVALPVVIAFVGFGDQLALLVYGSQWGEASRLLPIFAIGLAVVPLLHSTGPLFVALGRSRDMLRWGMFGSLVMVTGTLIGLRWGTTGVAIGWSTSMLVLVLPGLVYSFRGTDITLGRVAHSIGGIYAAAICGLGLAWLARQLVGGLPAISELVLGLSFSLLGYFALCYFAFGQKALMRDVVQRLRHAPGRPST